MPITNNPWRSVVIAFWALMFSSSATFADDNSSAGPKAMLQVAQARTETIWDYRFENGVRLQ